MFSSSSSAVIQGREPRCSEIVLLTLGSDRQKPVKAPIIVVSDMFQK